MSKKRVLLVAGAAVAVAALVWAFQPRPVPADLEEVGRGEVAVEIEEEGETRVRDRFVVSAPVGGRLLRLELEPGDPIRQGESVLGILQPADPSLLDSRALAEAREAVEAAEAAMNRAQAERARVAAALTFSEKELERMRRLAEEDIVSAERLEASELEVEQNREALEAARFGVENARHQVAVARSRLLEPVDGEGGASPIRIRAPIDGVVLRRLRESESVVAPGEPLLEVGDPEELEIVSDLLSTDAVRVDPGDPVRIERWGGDAPLAGVVRRVEPSGFTKISALGVEEQRVNVIVDFVEPREAWEELGDGYRVEIAIEVDRVGDAVTVPTSALFREGDSWAVFRRVDGEARVTTVELGLRNALKAEVRSGLSEGDVVVVHPGEGVEDGVEVEPRKL